MELRAVLAHHGFAIGTVVSSVAGSDGLTTLDVQAETPRRNIAFPENSAVGSMPTASRQKPRRTARAR